VSIALVQKDTPLIKPFENDSNPHRSEVCHRFDFHFINKIILDISGSLKEAAIGTAMRAKNGILSVIMHNPRACPIIVGRKSQIFVQIVNGLTSNPLKFTKIGGLSLELVTSSFLSG
jgi:hypothetical protein